MIGLAESFVNQALVGEGDSDQHLLTLFALAVSSRGKNFVELGVREGNSTLPLLMAAHLNDGTLWSVDVNETKFRPDEKMAGNWKFVQSDAVKFLTDWPEEKRIDVAFVDDWHAYRHVKAELDLLDRRVGPGSLVLLHDTMHGHSEPFYNVDLTLTEGQWAEGGPYRALAELSPQFWEFATVPWGHGLTILRKKYSKEFHRR